LSDALPKWVRVDGTGHPVFPVGQGGSIKKYWGLALIICEATTGKRTYYRTNYINQ